MFLWSWRDGETIGYHKFTEISMIVFPQKLSYIKWDALYICGLVLLFRLLVLFLSCLCMTSIHCMNRSPLLFPICSSRSSSLHTTIICVSIARVLPYPYVAKHVLCVHFRLFLSRFPFHPVNLYPIAPIRINYYSFTLIFDHSAQNPHNIMSGEISPTIGHKSWPIRP